MFVYSNTPNYVHTNSPCSYEHVSSQLHQLVSRAEVELGLLIQQIRHLLQCDVIDFKNSLLITCDRQLDHFKAIKLCIKNVT